MLLRGEVNEEGKKAVYSFYGLPRYLGFKLFFTRPVVLVFSHKMIENADKIYPFDSGAFQNKIYNPHLKGYSIDDFCIAGRNKSTKIDKLVALFFGDSNGYLDGSPVKCSFSKDKIEHDLIKLYADDPPCASDERKKTFEAIFYGNIKINKHLCKVVMPKTNYKYIDKKTKALIDKFQLLFYEDNYYSSPQTDRDKLIRCVYDEINSI